MYPSPHLSAERYRSDDLDEIRELLRPYGEQHDRQQRGGGPLGWQMAASQGRRTTVGWVRGELPQLVRAAVSSPTLHLPLHQRLDYRIGGRTLTALPTRAFLAAPEEAYDVYLEAGTIMGLKLDAQALENELSARLGGDASTWSSMEVPLMGTGKRRLEQILHDFVERLDAPVSEENAASLDQAEGRLLDWVAFRIQERSDQGVGLDAGLRRVHLVEEWVDDHLGDSITLGRLCTVARVGARTLQTSFRRWRGQTPLEFVRERRLAVARMRLMEPDTALSVTEVALSCGFHHLGRFSVLYREKFGTSPSETLRAV